MPLLGLASLAFIWNVRLERLQVLGWLMMDESTGATLSCITLMSFEALNGPAAQLMLNVLLPVVSGHAMLNLLAVAVLVHVSLVSVHVEFLFVVKLRVYWLFAAALVKSGSDWLVDIVSGWLKSTLMSVDRVAETPARLAQVNCTLCVYAPLLVFAVKMIV